MSKTKISFLFLLVFFFFFFSKDKGNHHQAFSFFPRPSALGSFDAPLLPRPLRPSAPPPLGPLNGWP